MAASQPDADYDEPNEVLSLSGPGFYLQVRISPEEMRSLSAVGAASWLNRGSIKAGEALGNPVFWSQGSEDPTAVVVLVGADDEAWELSLEIPWAALLRVLPRS